MLLGLFSHFSASNKGTWHTVPAEFFLAFPQIPFLPPCLHASATIACNIYSGLQTCAAPEHEGGSSAALPPCHGQVQPAKLRSTVQTLCARRWASKQNVSWNKIDQLIVPGKSCCSRFLGWLFVFMCRLPKHCWSDSLFSLGTAATECSNTVIQRNCCNSLHVWFLELSVEMLHLCLPICTARFGKTTCQKFFPLISLLPLGPYPSSPSSSPLSSETVEKTKSNAGLHLLSLVLLLIILEAEDKPHHLPTLPSKDYMRTKFKIWDGDRTASKEKDYAVF